MKRVVPGILLAVGWLLILFKGSPAVFAGVLVVVAFWAADEYVRMAGADRFPLLRRLLLDGIMILPLLGTIYAGSVSRGAIFGLLLAFALLTIFIFAVYADFPDGYELLCRMVFGSVYLGVLSSFLVALRYLPDGNGWLLVLSAVTAGSDTGAYYIGRAFGKSKLCPAISPNKTRAGAWGGFVFGIVAAVIFAQLFLVRPQWGFVVFAAALLTVSGIVGDLTESVVKRGTGVKDSGHCLGGHGGVLDRIDSLLFCGPVLYCLLVFVK
ncbi:MAG: hypothetical protein F9K32_01250 [Desulfobulbaceae bacterium]|nr:MAG: hypothetical protein F9K32_01250 [Desulfobulbaceae bacterium]